MSAFCIGGVCVPYSALLPVLIIGLQWIAAQFAKVGLLPASVARRLGLDASGKKVTAAAAAGACANKGCCGDGGDAAATAAAAADDGDGDGARGWTVEHVDGLERWREIVASRGNATLVVKFTAEWCKPCKAIQPAYVRLAERYGGKGKFVTLDIDGDDCDVLSGELRVAMMPTFVCFKGGAEAGRMSGGNDAEKLGDWVAEMCS